MRLPRPTRLACRLMLSLALLMAAGAATASAQEADLVEEQRLAPLRLVEHVGVLVEDLTPDAEAVALTREIVEADATARLRIARLRVADEPSFPPLFYVQVSVLCNAGGTCAVDVSSSLIQDVYLLQAASRSSKARTWSTGRLVLAPRAVVATRVREMVREQADLFAADLLSARQRFATPISQVR